MIESVLAGVLALIVALATVPGVVFFVAKKVPHARPQEERPARGRFHRWRRDPESNRTRRICNPSARSAWSALVFFVGWRWAMHKATTAPEWFARRNAQAENVEASARAAWARIVEQFDRAKG